MRIGARVLATMEGIGIALDAIRSNRVRAALTIMGVAVGVFVVVAMGATIHGISESFRADVSEMGASTFMVRRRGIGINSCDGTDDTCPERRNPPVTLAEWRLISNLTSVQAAVPMFFGGLRVKYHDRNLSAVNYEAYGTQWLETDGGNLLPGRNFTEQENNAAAFVAILNDTLAKQLFGQSDPIGKQVSLNDQQFTVIGVYQATAGFLKSMNGRGPDRPKVILPLETARRHLGASARWIMLTVKPQDGVTRDAVMDEVTAVMRAPRGLRPSQPNNFALVGQDRLLEVFDQLFGAIFLVVLTLSAVGLRVGGAGLAHRVWRMRLVGGQALHLRAGARGGRGAAAVADGCRHVRAGPHRSRDRRAEGASSASDPVRRGLLVSGIFRAPGWLGPRGAADACGG